MPPQFPQGDRTEQHEIGKQKRSEWWRSMHNVLEESAGWTIKVSQQVQSKTEYANHGLKQQNRGTQYQKALAHADQKRHQQKTHREGAANNRQPLDRSEKAVHCVIGKTENEVAEETSQRQQQHPVCPFGFFRV